jgi:hypothetical protein
VAESLGQGFIKGRNMKKIVGFAIVAVLFTDCGDGESGQREYEMKDNTVEPPTTSPQSNTTSYDTSATGVQDSSTTVGHDTGAVRKN